MFELLREYGKTAGTVAVLVLIVLLAFNVVTVVPAGHVGVPVLFGKVQDYHLKEGMHIVNPLLNIVKMSVRTQEIKETAEVPSSEGLMVNVEASLLYNLSPEDAPVVYRTLGPEYRSVFVEPQFRSHLRGVTASFEAKALYTSQREIISSKVEESIQPVFTKRGFASANVLLRKITLPQLVTAAIEQKLSAEQDAQRMAFVLQKEEQEAQRKRVEAKGIKDFQSIVTQGITPQLLTWKGIEATERLANSDNSKIVVIGAGKGGLPLILNPAQ